MVDHPVPEGGDSQVHVSIRDITKAYGSFEILHGVSFDVLRGKTNVVIGASGAGKTVLMRQIIRLERPDTGTIVVDGQDIVPLGELALGQVRKKFGMVFQMSALFDSMSVFDNVAFPLREHTRLRARAVREKVMDRLEKLGVGAAHRKMPSELSGGMKKRVAVARALVLEPAILIYDEPTTGLDPVTSRTVDELILQTQESFGVTSLVISHDMASVFHIADQIHFLYKGRVEVSGTPAEIAGSSHPPLLEFLRASGVDAAAVAAHG